MYIRSPRKSSTLNDLRFARVLEIFEKKVAMSNNENSARFRGNSNQAQPVRTKVVMGLVVVAVVALFCALKFHRQPSVAQPVPVATEIQPKAPAPAKPLPPAIVSAPTPQAPQPKTVVTVSQLSPEKLTPEQLVDELTKIGSSGLVTPEDAARFKADLNELIQRGPASVAAIKAFLDKSLDIAYKDVNGGDQIGFSTLRSSMIDALRQIGGPEAQAAMVATLQTTAAPSELLQLAGALNQQAPGRYRDQIVAAAQATLKMAAANQLGTNVELAPIMHMLQAYGAPSSMADAAKNNPAEFSSAIQLANLPDGQGLPALSRLAQDSSNGSQLMATEMIAQLAGQNSDALNTLAQLVQDGKVKSGDWVQLAPLLAGQQFQPDSSAQGYSMVNQDMTPDQISQRIMLLDTFMDTVPDGSGPYKALAQQRNVLASKIAGN